MNDETTDKPAAESQNDTAPTPEEKAQDDRDPVRTYTRILLAIVVVLFIWYVWADRVAPWTDQARVDAFIVPITPKISGIVKEVNVVQDQIVEAGDVLAQIDRREYELAVQRAEAALEIAGQDTGADTAAVAASEAALAEARARRVKAQQDLERIESVYRQDPGAVSSANVDSARAAEDAAAANEANAVADLEEAKQRLGAGGEDNPRVRDAVAALEQARIDLADTTLYAPSSGGITNLEVEVGHYAKEGTPVMTFVSDSNVWIEAYLRENSLSNIREGDRVEILLDMVPGKVWTGKVVSRGYAVQKPTQGQTGGLITVKSDSGWLRDAQRFPVVIEFDGHDGLTGHRFVGGQADVQIYTGKSNVVLDALGSFWVRFMSWMSYVY